MTDQIAPDLTIPPMPGPTLHDFRAARERVADVVSVTPLEHSSYLSGLLGSPTWFKAESLQKTGSYKIRGAYNRLARLSEDERARGVVAASAGNHA